ncbi:hypothetical protein EDD15DRAFT_2197302 [Pisolithus albus]|nr:hypothetical protein EDD15DRAFT_2197302 [Pisolithus albus]
MCMCASCVAVVGGATADSGGEFVVEEADETRFLTRDMYNRSMDQAADHESDQRAGTRASHVTQGGMTGFAHAPYAIELWFGGDHRRGYRRGEVRSQRHTRSIGPNVTSARRDVHLEECEDDRQEVTSRNISTSRSFNDMKPKTDLIMSHPCPSAKRNRKRATQFRVGNLCVWNGLQRGRIYIILEKRTLVCMSSGMFKRMPSDNATCLALSAVVVVTTYYETCYTVLHIPSVNQGEMACSIASFAKKPPRSIEDTRRAATVARLDQHVEAGSSTSTLVCPSEQALKSNPRTCRDMYSRPQVHIERRQCPFLFVRPTLETFVDILISGVDPVGPTHAAALPPGFFVSLSQVKHLFAHPSGSRGRSLPHSSITRAIDEVDGESSSSGVVSSASSTLGDTTDCEAYGNDRLTPPQRSRWNLNTLLDRLRLSPRSSCQRLHEQWTSTVTRSEYQPRSVSMQILRGKFGTSSPRGRLRFRALIQSPTVISKPKDPPSTGHPWVLVCTATRAITERKY